MQRLSQDTNLVLISDHGSGMYLKDVNVNQWLKEKGYLKMKRTPSTALKGLLRSLGVTPQSVIGLALKMGIGRVAKPSPSVAGGLPKRVLDSIGYTWKDIDWRRTKAYSFGYYGEIFINLKGRETQGSVEPAEYDELREEIIAQLKTMKVSDSGERLVDHVWKREELYWGNKTDMAPDINLCMRDYSYAAATMLAFPSGRIFSPPKTLKSGEHRGHGILLAYGAGVTKGCRIDNAEIVDLAPTILELMGVDIPSDMDGKVLREVLQD
ncbi:MAG: alkaline phosphatase family protein, partial [Dehalococcoidia bacterium]|nr:alkaline phosphatase family protein [Dehalococcoidia bacterium]